MMWIRIVLCIPFILSFSFRAYSQPGAADPSSRSMALPGNGNTWWSPNQAGVPAEVPLPPAEKKEPVRTGEGKSHHLEVWDEARQYKKNHPRLGPYPEDDLTDENSTAPKEKYRSPLGPYPNDEVQTFTPEELGAAASDVKDPNYPAASAIQNAVWQIPGLADQKNNLCVDYQVVNGRPEFSIAFGTDAFEKGSATFKKDASGLNEEVMKNLVGAISNATRSQTGEKGKVDVYETSYADGTHYYKSNQDRDANRLDLAFSERMNRRLSGLRSLKVKKIIDGYSDIGVVHEDIQISDELESDAQFDRNRDQLSCPRRRKVKLTFKMHDQPSLPPVVQAKKSHRLTLKPDFINDGAAQGVRDAASRKIQEAFKSLSEADQSYTSAPQKILEALEKNGSYTSCPAPMNKIAIAYIEVVVDQMRPRSERLGLELYRELQDEMSMAGVDYDENVTDKAAELTACFRIPTETMKSAEMETRQSGLDFMRAAGAGANGTTGVEVGLGAGQYSCARCKKGVDIAENGQTTLSGRVLGKSQEIHPLIQKMAQKDPFTLGSLMVPRVWIVINCDADCKKCGKTEINALIRDQFSEAPEAKDALRGHKIYTIDPVSDPQHLSHVIPKDEFVHACIVQPKIVHTCSVEPIGSAHAPAPKLEKISDEAAKAKALPFALNQVQTSATSSFSCVSPSVNQLFKNLMCSGDPKKRLPTTDQYGDCALDRSKRVERLPKTW